MKKLLLILLAIPLLGGCEKSEEELLMIDAEAEVALMFDQYGDYDVTQVEELLSGKRWGIVADLRYENNFQKIDAVIHYRDHFTGYVGNAYYKYGFERDGEVIDETNGLPYTAPAKFGTWQFDAENRLLIFHMESGRNYAVRLQAIGGNRLMWDSEDDTRQIFEVKSTEPYTEEEKRTLRAEVDIFQSTDTDDYQTHPSVQDALVDKQWEIRTRIFEVEGETRTAYFEQQSYVEEPLCVSLRFMGDGTMEWTWQSVGDPMGTPESQTGQWHYEQHKLYLTFTTEEGERKYKYNLAECGKRFLLLREKESYGWPMRAHTLYEAKE